VKLGFARLKESRWPRSPVPTQGQAAITPDPATVGEFDHEPDVEHDQQGSDSLGPDLRLVDHRLFGIRNHHSKKTSSLMQNVREMWGDIEIPQSAPDNEKDHPRA